jgi:gamma-glutamyltranspeptidase
VVDRDGGLVATTTTLNTAYGNGITVPGAGFLLNNEMDDFTAKPGAPNAYGLRQGSQNAIAPGRRPLSSMTPTLVFRPDGTPLLATGSPGGVAGVAESLGPWPQPGFRGGRTPHPQPAVARPDQHGGGHQP